LPWYSCRSTAADSTRALKRRTAGADLLTGGRSVIGLCGGFGCFVGGYVPVLWGASSLSVESLLFGALGAIAGIWLGVRISES
jgi:hypothetical protein